MASRISLVCMVFFLFFKQKTAYELRISDWSSDVCSSDLLQRKVGTNVVVDLRLKDIKEPRESDIWLRGAIGPRMVYSTNLDAARRACDRRMVTFAHTARSDERRVGKEGVSTCRSWWSP